MTNLVWFLFSEIYYVKTMRRKKYQVIFLVLLLTIVSCKKIEKISPVPFIEFKSFSLFDTLDILGNNSKAGRLDFYFEDGDGDLGLEAPTDDQTDTTNLFLALFRKEGGLMLPVTDTRDPLLPYSSYRIPYMERLGQNKILKGTISVIFMYLSYSPTDTIRYDFYIEDRAENLSNTASTAEIAFTANNVYTTLK